MNKHMIYNIEKIISKMQTGEEISAHQMRARLISNFGTSNVDSVRSIAHFLSRDKRFTARKTYANNTNCSLYTKVI